MGPSKTELEKRRARQQRYRKRNAGAISARKRHRYANNISGVRDRARARYWANRDEALARSQGYQAKNKKQIAARKRRWYYENREHLLKESAERTRKRLKTDLTFRITHNLRGRLSTAIRDQKTYKHSKTLQLLGCTLPQLRAHLEKQFTAGMTWKNYGYRGWHIDHKRPCKSFDLSLPDQQRACFHYMNLQPLWGKDNMTKSARWEK